MNISLVFYPFATHFHPIYCGFLVGECKQYAMLNIAAIRFYTDIKHSGLLENNVLFHFISVDLVSPKTIIPSDAAQDIHIFFPQWSVSNFQQFSLRKILQKIMMQLVM